MQVSGYGLVTDRKTISRCIWQPCHWSVHHCSIQIDRNKQANKQTKHEANILSNIPGLGVSRGDSEDPLKISKK